MTEAMVSLYLSEGRAKETSSRKDVVLVLDGVCADISSVGFFSRS
jgi:hypothetical protein